MLEDSRLEPVRRLLFEYVKSPSLRHIRDPHSLNKLAREIVRIFTADVATWKKWGEQREALLRAAKDCWIPVNDLRDYLNGMAGTSLTVTDVVQRLRALWEEDFAPYPNEDLQASCLAIYEKEKAYGTELPAIIGELQEHVEREEERIRDEHEKARREYAREEQHALEQRFLSGADCKWTSVHGSKQLYCRINGRSYRLSPTADKKWTLHRIGSIEDGVGTPIGRYRYRRDATKALAKIAYESETKR